MTLDAAREHSAATLFEAATAQWARDGQGEMRECAVDPTIKATWLGARVAGWAFTVRGTGGDNLALHRAIQSAEPGEVLVVDLQGSQHGHWGEVLAVAAQARGIAGLVIDGGVRDREELRALGFPVFSRNDSVRGTVKADRGDLGTEIMLAGVRVVTGDLIVADSDGVVVIPRNRVDAVLDEADRRVLQEQKMFDGLRAGRTSTDLYNLDGEDLPQRR